MAQPDRQERQPAAQRDTPPSRPAGYTALARARARFEGSLAQSFLRRLQALDFADQAILFGAGLLVSLLPLVILLSAFASHRINEDISLRLGLDRQAAGIMDQLFTAAPATLNTATATSLVFLVLGMLAAAALGEADGIARQLRCQLLLDRAATIQAALAGRAKHGVSALPGMFRAGVVIAARPVAGARLPGAASARRGYAPPPP
jgi:hypothetical protein